MHLVSASSLNSVAKRESSTPMARHVLQTSGYYVCLSFLSASIQHSSIKVYLSAVQSLHIEQGFSDPLLNCLWLKQVLRGVKRAQGSSAA